MPDFLLFYLKRSKIDSYLNLKLALEILRHSPRVPAGAASSIFESTGSKNFACLVYNVKGLRLLPLTVFLDTAGVFFSGLTLDNKTDGNIAAADPDVSFDQLLRWHKIKLTHNT